MAPAVHRSEPPALPAPPPGSLTQESAGLGIAPSQPPRSELLSPDRSTGCRADGSAALNAHKTDCNWTMPYGGKEDDVKGKHTAVKGKYSANTTISKMLTLRIRRRASRSCAVGGSPANGKEDNYTKMALFRSCGGQSVPAHTGHCLATPP